MILYFMSSIKEIFRGGRCYRFPKPSRCLRQGCGNITLWGHGYVEAYFEGYDSPVCLKRYRCSDCGCVYRLRPFGYWPRHPVSIRVIVQSLCHRVEKGQWDRSKGLSRQRQGNWLRALRRNITLLLGMDFSGGPLDGFYELLHRGKVPLVRLG